MPETADTPDLGELLRTGAVLYGVPVKAVRIVTADGRVQRLMLPEVPTAAGEGGKQARDQFVPEKLTPMQAAIVQVVDEMRVSEVLSYDGLAERAGYSNSGPLRKFVQEYAERAGRLDPHPKGWEKIR